MKYVPVLRYRREERNALKSSVLSSKTVPLIEIMKELAGLKRKGTFESTHLEDFKSYDYPFMVDFPIYFHVTNSTTKKIRDFMMKLKADPRVRLDYFKQLSPNLNIIPVISYNIEISYAIKSYISDAVELRKYYKRIAFRLFQCSDFDNMLTDITSAINDGDILIYDIGDTSHTLPILKSNYSKIQALKRKKNITTVIIRAAINKDIVLNRLVDNTPVLGADNSLLTEYKKYGFDCFGDFAGIRKDYNITDGGPEDPSPGFLFYHWDSNCYIGYKGRIPDWNEFTTHIKPKVTSSAYWKSFSSTHHANCPGCLEISKSPNNQAASWKRYSIQHYLYCMEEFL